MNGYCTADAVVVVFGPTLGRSPRLTVVAGERAVDLVASPLTAAGARCLDCAAALLEELSSDDGRSTGE